MNHKALLLGLAGCLAVAGVFALPGHQNDPVKQAKMALMAYNCKSIQNSMIKTLFAEIKSQLQRSLPELSASLNEGASDEAIAAVETAISHSLPDDVKEMYQMHNGETQAIGLFLGISFLSLDEALSEWKSWNAHGLSSAEDDAAILSFPPNHVQERNVVPLQFPIGSDGGGNFLGIDLDPGSGGTVGQVINFGRDETNRYVIAKSITDFLAFVLHEIRRGNYSSHVDGDPFFSLKEPENGHLFDILGKLPCPVSGNPQVAAKPVPSLDAQAWFEALDEQWKSIVAEKCGQNISWEAVEAVTSLSLLRKDVTDTGPLARFTGLRELILSGNPVSDLRPLAGLRQLKKLYLSKTAVSDLSPLAGMESLVELSLSGLKIHDIAPLLRCKKLRSLDLEGAALTDLEMVGQLTALTSLTLGECNYSAYAPLQKLRNLSKLGMRKTNAQDISWMASLQKINDLTLYKNNITDYSPIAQLPNLKYVTCEIAAFLMLKDALPYRVSFTIAGGMSDSERKIYMDYQLQK